MKFKVGDTVKIKCSSDSYMSKIVFMIGKESIIERVYMQYTGRVIYLVQCLTNPNDCWAFYEDELELVEEENKMETREELEKQLAEIKAKLDKLPKKNIIEVYTTAIFTPDADSDLWSEILGLGYLCPNQDSDYPIKVRITIEEIRDEN